MTTDYPIYSTLDALSHLDDENFVIACSANEELQMICDGKFKPGHQKYFGQLTDYLYMRRSEAYFDKSLIKFKDDSVTWKDFYKQVAYLVDNIKDEDLVYLLIAKKAILPLKILYKIKPFVFIDQTLANRASGYGNVEILDFLKDINLLPNQYGVFEAAGNGNIAILEWMKNNNIPITNNINVLNSVAANGDLETLKFFYKNGLIPQEVTAIWAAQNYHINILKWMKETNLPLIDLNGFYGKSLTTSYPDVVRWLKSENLVF